MEAAEHMNSGLTETQNLGVNEGEVENGPVSTMLGELTLSMFQQGSGTRVRVGSPTASSELYEGTFDSTEDANAALLEAGILTQDKLSNMSEPAGTGIHLTGVSAEQLQNAGLRRHNI